MHQKIVISTNSLFSLIAAEVAKSTNVEAGINLKGEIFWKKKNSFYMTVTNEKRRMEKI